MKGVWAALVLAILVAPMASDAAAGAFCKPIHIEAVFQQFSDNSRLRGLVFEFLSACEAHNSCNEDAVEKIVQRYGKRSSLQKATDSIRMRERCTKNLRGKLILACLHGVGEQRSLRERCETTASAFVAVVKVSSDTAFQRATDQ